jgi:hypothetical protein
MEDHEQEDAIDLFFSRREAINLILAGATAGACVSTTGCKTTDLADNDPVKELPIAKPRGTIPTRICSRNTCRGSSCSPTKR